MANPDNMISRHELSNGLTVISEKIPHLKTIALGVYIKAGSRYETDSDHGVSHFIEHLFFKGTENRSSAALAHEIDSMGGVLNAYADKEITCFFAKILSEHLEKAVTLFSDILCNSRFSQEEIDKEKMVILQEISASEESPDDFLFDRFYRRVFHSHPLGRSVLGTTSSVLSMTREKICSYFNRFYTPDRIIISASGDVDHQHLVDLVEEKFCANLRKGIDVTIKAPLPPERSEVVISKPAEQVHIVMGGPGPGYSHPKRHVVSILNSLLGGSMSSRLFQRLRNREGLVYSIYSFFSMYQDAGVMGIYCASSPENYLIVREKILHELHSVKQGDVTEDELTKAKDHLKGVMYMSMESTDARMHLLAKSAIYFQRVMTFPDLIKMIESVTRDDVIELANQAFDEKYMITGMLGDFEGVSSGLKIAE